MPAFEDMGEGFLEVRFGLFEGIAFGDCGGDFFHPAGVSSLGCGFVNGSELHEMMLPDQSGFSILNDLGGCWCEFGNGDEAIVVWFFGGRTPRRVVVLFG